MEGFVGGNREKKRRTIVERKKAKRLLVVLSVFGTAEKKNLEKAQE